MVATTDIILFANNVSALLNNDVAPGDGSIVLASGQGAKYPSPTAGEYFVVTLQNLQTGEIEVCNCTGRTGDLLTVERAQEGTTAQAFTAADSIVQMRLTKGILEKLIQRRFTAADAGKYLYVNADGTVSVSQGTSGAFYEGETLGAGAGVYESVDDNVDPRLLKFRSLVAGSNVSIIENEADITISASGGGGTYNNLPSFAAGTVVGTCGTTTTIFPSALAGLEVGDLMMWHVVSAALSNVTNQLPTPPAGWSILWRGFYLANQYRFSSWFYKYADANDLDPGTSYDYTSTTQKCSNVYVVKNPHPLIPFAGASGGHLQTHSANARVGFALEGSAIFNSWWWFSSAGLPVSWSDTAGAYLGVPQDITAEMTPGGNNNYTRAWDGVRIARFDGDENWIPGETATSSMQGPGWTYQGVSIVQSGTYQSRMDSNGLLGRHYIERSVNLIAGETYSFGCLIKAQWQSGDQEQITVSYVDTGENERLMHIYGSGIERNTGAALRLDPLADYGTVWGSNTLFISEDGVPSTTGCTAGLWFVAQTTGTYKIRFGISTAAAGETFSGAATRRIMGCVFRRGRRIYRRVNTPNGAVYSADQYGRADGAWWETPNGAATVNHQTIACNPAADALPRAFMMPNQNVFADLAAWDYYPFQENRVIPVFETTDDLYVISQATRPIMPRLSGILQRYYLEFQIVTSGGDIEIGCCYPLHSLGGADEGPSHLGYYWNFGQGIVSPVSTTAPDVGGSTPTTGSVIGMEIDFVNSQIKWYNNGILVKTQTMLLGDPDTSVGANSIHPETPMWAFAHTLRASGSESTGNVTVNLHGPFAYPVPGCLPYDWIAAAEPVDPITEIVDAGAGIPLIVPGSGGTQIKSLLQGPNITLTDNVTEIEIGANYGTAPSYPDPQSQYQFYTDFIEADVGTAGSNTEIGEYLSGTNAATGISGEAQAAGTMGLHFVTTGTTAAGRAVIGSRDLASLQTGDGEVEYKARFKLRTSLSDGTNTFSVWSGLINNGAPQSSTALACCVIDPAVNSGNFSLRTRTGGATFDVDTGIAPVAEQYYRVRVLISAAGDAVYLYIDGVLVATSGTNVPTSSDRLGWGHGIVKTVGTTARVSDIDYMFMRKSWNVGR